MKKTFSIRILLPFLYSVSIHCALLVLFLISPKDSQLSLKPTNPPSKNLSELITVEMLEFSKAETINTAFAKKAGEKNRIHNPDEKADVSIRKNEATSHIDARSKNEYSQSSSDLAKNFPSSQDEILSLYLAELRSLFERKKSYPTLSRKMGETGRVIVSLTLLPDGQIIDVKIKTKSQFARLNQGALETVSGTEKYKPLPDSYKKENLIVDIPIEFSL